MPPRKSEIAQPPCDQPVIVSGGTRGVVAVAYYVARTFGVSFRHADVPKRAADARMP